MEFYGWYEKGELTYPTVYKALTTAVPVLCDTSKLACNALTKEHHLRGGPLP
jgi:hypothetical protein